MGRFTFVAKSLREEIDKEFTPEELALVQSDRAAEKRKSPLRRLERNVSREIERTGKEIGRAPGNVKKITKAAGTFAKGAAGAATFLVLLPVIIVGVIIFLVVRR